MAEEVAVENDWISNYEWLVTSTLTLDWAILHAVVHRSSTSTCMPNFIEIKDTFCGQTDVCTYIRMHRQMDGHLRLALLG